MALSKHLSAEQRRAATVEAVIELAGVQNPGEITTAAIAAHMNVTQGALFRHFPSKEAIWEEVMQWVACELLSRMDAAAAGITTPLAAMEAMFLSHAEFVATHPGVPRMIFGELQQPQSTPARRRVHELLGEYAVRLHQLIQDAKDCGQVNASLQSKTAVVLFIGAIQGLVMQSLLAGDVTRIGQDAPALFALYRRSIEAFP